MKTFETERLLLNHTTERDAEFIFELLNTPKWIQFIGNRNIQTLADAEKYIQIKMTPQFERLGFSNFTITRKSDKTKLGTCGLYDREGLEEIDIGFAFLPAYEKQGYAFEAATKIKEIAFNEFGIKKLCAITLETNFASQNLLKKLGLKSNGLITLPNEVQPLLLYNIEL